jgi:ABC-type multidrug transport system fused ATPase/permease subunit
VGLAAAISVRHRRIGSVTILDVQGRLTEEDNAAQLKAGQELLMRQAKILLNSGAEGNETHTLFIPVEAVRGNTLNIQTGEGNDSLSIDLAAGLGGKTVAFDGGAGDDSFTLLGESVNTATYNLLNLLSGGATQIQLDNGSNAIQLQLQTIENISDQLTANKRQFSLDRSIGVVGLNNSEGASNLWKLASSGSQSISFAAPAAALAIDAGNQTSLTISGNLDFRGSSFSVHSGTIELNDVIFSYDKVTSILSQVSIEIPEGEWTVFTGASGAGKSTLEVDNRSMVPNRV